jgi:hypothetical protein
MSTAITRLKSGSILFAGLATLAGTSTHTMLSFTGATNRATSLADSRGSLSGISPFELPAAHRGIWYVGHRIAAATYVELVFTNELLIAWDAVDLLIVSSPNDIVASFTAYLRSTIHARVLRLAVYDVASIDSPLSTCCPAT